jgi:hypothetical protein
LRAGEHLSIGGCLTNQKQPVPLARLVSMSSLTLIPSITTHNKRGSTWREKVSEIAPLGLREVGLFVTGFHKAERMQCYRILLDIKKHHDFSIPFVHAVSDMDDSEYAFLRHEFGTRWFNLHPLREFPLIHSLSEETRSYILLENSCFVDPLTREDLAGFAGLCIDISHLEDARLTNTRVHQHIVELCLEYPVCANHISAIARPSSKVHRGQPQYSTHHMESPHEMEYLRAAPRECVAPLAALELENPLHEQVNILEQVRHSLLLTQASVRRLAA